MQRYFFFGFFLLLAFFFVATKLDAELDYLTIPKANAKSYSGGASVCLLSARFFALVSVIRCGV